MGSPFRGARAASKGHGHTVLQTTARLADDLDRFSRVVTGRS
jgi:hypothetical protein